MSPFKTYLQKAVHLFCPAILLSLFTISGFAQGRTIADFDKGWHFHLGNRSEERRVGKEC